MGEPFIELHQHHRALEQEFKNLNLDENNTPDEIRQKTRKFAIAHLESALTTIAELVTSADKETTQLAAAKTVIQIAQGTSPKDEADPISTLFNELVKNDAAA